MIHDMKLDPQPFEMIKSGRKTIELRLYDEKRQKVNEGDIIRFACTEDENEVIEVKVLKLHKFRDFAELYEKLPLLKCGYTEFDIDRADAKDMESYYSLQRQKKYGVVGIEILKI